MDFKIKTQKLQRQPNKSRASACNSKQRFFANCQNSNNVAAFGPKLTKIKWVKSERKKRTLILVQGPLPLSNYLKLLIREIQINANSKFYTIVVIFLTFKEMLQMPNQLSLSLKDPNYFVSLLPLPSKPFCKRKLAIRKLVKKVKNPNFGICFSHGFD